MEIPASSSPCPFPELHQYTAPVSAETPPNPLPSDPNPTFCNFASFSKPPNSRKYKKKRLIEDVQSSSSCSTNKGKALALKRRNVKVRLGQVRRPTEGTEMEAIALPLGMSFAAVVAKVLERKDAAGDRMSIDHLSRICASAVRESLTNVFGRNFDYFARNFEKSFGSTLRTLRLINESSTTEGYLLKDHHVSNSYVPYNEEGCSSNSELHDCHSETDLPTIATRDILTTTEGETEQTSASLIYKELVLHDQNNQLVCASSGSVASAINNNVLSTTEKSVVEQVRSNDLKALELGLAMKRLKLKEAQFALNYDSNHLERSKLAMGISKASFKAEKFKTQLEDMRFGEFLQKCIDCLVAGIVLMSASLSYAAYVFSYKKISEATAACLPLQKESKPWWMPNTVSSFHSGLHTVKCQVQVMSRMIFGFLMILAIAYLLFQRSASSGLTMPITFIFLLFGFACGFAGKLCVDTLGGSGYSWLIYWEILCLLHFFANVCTSPLFVMLHGPVNISQGKEGKTVVPYWARRSMFYTTLLLFLPLICGLMPFATLYEWRDHFSVLILGSQSSSIDN
ncbi:protein CPR-5-like [Mangifera indica]|uniref:protein CPR-5-like n=1 Tax=Mangifera indica TaxID=29780 RepID=UPI001CFBD007|nr:protein CPR-5-like [Mangifera indica]